MAHDVEHSLRANVLGTADPAMMAVAGSAPAYSIAATTATSSRWPVPHR
jgi:hypothetical protein